MNLWRDQESMLSSAVCVIRINMPFISNTPGGLLLGFMAAHFGQGSDGFADVNLLGSNMRRGRPWLNRYDHAITGKQQKPDIDTSLHAYHAIFIRDLINHQGRCERMLRCRLQTMTWKIGEITGVSRSFHFKSYMRRP